MSKLNLPLASPFSKENLQYAFDQLARFANKGIGADNVTANSLTGAEIDESTLSGIPLSALAATSGGWVTDTPTWASSGTQPAIGNGTLTGRYFKIGTLVVAHIRMVAGTTTTFGTGTYSFSCGGGGVWAFSTINQSGHGFIFDSSAAAVFPIFWAVIDGTHVQPNSSGSGPVTGTVPIALATGDALDMNFAAEVF